MVEVLSSRRARKIGFRQSWQWIIDHFKAILKRLKTRMFRGDLGFLKKLAKNALGNIFGRNIRFPRSWLVKFTSERIRDLVVIFARYIRIGTWTLVENYDRIKNNIVGLSQLTKTLIPNMGVLNRLGLLEFKLPFIKQAVAKSILNPDFLQ